MVETLTRTGNSLALVLDRSILEATGIDVDTKLEVSTDGDVIVVSPVRSRKRTARLRKALDDLDRHRSTHRQHSRSSGIAAIAQVDGTTASPGCGVLSGFGSRQ
jgi:antitoxin component of MazEF toxin-antitoxin module